ncbi:MAG: CHRD domain-containing protein [Actinomycetota bacterium]|nr:CHRD domain-containing protein [Actinomycetota bacterium]
MTRNFWSAAVIAALLALTAACGDDADNTADNARDEARETATSVAQEAEEATRLSASLTGRAEVPGPGDPDGTGTATVNLNVSEGEVCYEVAVQNLDQPTAMHIHEGEEGKSGDVVVTLTTPTATDTTTSGCTNEDLPLIARLAAQPDNFYVNVHTGTYPQGAVRGQLSQ